MEAYSVEDDGDGITFNVFCYNVQPGYKINYATGEIVKDQKKNKKNLKCNRCGNSFKLLYN